MHRPRSGSVRSVRFAALALTVVLAAGCTGSPPIESGTLAQAQQRVLALVNATGEAIGSPAEFKPVRSATELPCYKTLLGYTVSHLKASRASVPILFSIKGNVQGPALLPRVERYWESRGYPIDRSGLSDSRFPKVRAHVGDDLLVATGFAGAATMTLYGVSPCTRP
jgi:hypothetical protein